ncbi:unnamed protein product, partial [Prorocentrum cordatum]
GTTLVWPGYAAPRSTRCECAARPEQRASLQAAPRPHPPHAAGEHGGAGRQKTQPRHTGEGEEQEEKQEEEVGGGKGGWREERDHRAVCHHTRRPLLASPRTPS